MLLSGGFARDVAQLLLIFRQAEKDLSRRLETAPASEAESHSTGEGSDEASGKNDESGEERSWVEERGEEGAAESSAGGAEWEADAREDRRRAQEGGIWDEDVMGEPLTRESAVPKKCCWSS